MRTATRSLVAWLEDFLAKVPDGTRLPTDTELGRSHGLSRKTVEKVMRAYAEKGALSRRPGSGTFKGAAPERPVRDRPQPQPSSAGSLADRIVQSIHRGELKQGEALPSVKYMVRRFRVAPATVIAAYRELQRSGLLTKVGKTFWLGRFERLVHPQERREVLLVVNSREEMVDAFRADVYAGAYNRLELTLASAGFMLRTVTAEQYHAILEQRRRRRTYPHGIVFFRQKRVFFPPLLEALKALRATKGAPPVAAVCDWDDRPFYSFPRDMRVLSRPNLNTTNARALAVFLDEKSFVKPVFVIGRRDIFGRKPYAWDFGDVLKTWVEVRRLSRTSDFAVAVVDAAKGETLADTRIAPPNEEFDSMLSKFEPTSYADLSVHIGLYESVAEALRAHAKADVMVFQQDNHAAEALDLLQSQGRKVPEDVSAVSVDKSPAYLNRGFTRCELDQDSIGYLMAHAIIGDFAVPRTTKGFIRVNARVIEKLTTP